MPASSPPLTDRPRFLDACSLSRITPYQKQIENCYFERNDPSKMSEIILQTRSCDPRKISLESTLNLGGKTETQNYRIISIRISNVYRAKIPSLECFKRKVTKNPQRSELHVKLEKFLGLYYYLLSPLSYQICVDYLNISCLSQARHRCISS